MKKCDHQESLKLISTFKGNQTVRDIINKFHPETGKFHEVTVKGYASTVESASLTKGFDIDLATPLAELKDLGI